MTARPHPTFCTQCGQELVDSALFCPACGTPKSANADADPLIGQVLGQRFLVLERMGHGASGTMYRGEHTTLRRKVAIKLLHHELCQNDLAVERFRREAITVSNIDNDHIVEIYDLGRAPDERLYLVMELLEGESLQRAVAHEKRLAIDKMVDILIQTGEALSEAHAMGYVHRDLRPCNIFLARRRGRLNFVKLLDFGLAKLVADEGNAAMTSLGLNFGDPKYMSPEQARGDVVDRRADIYSLGCIAYEMLVGHAPFVRGKAFEILAGHVEAMPKEPRALRNDVPAWLSSTVMRMLAKEPDARFVTVYRLVEALREGLNTGSVMSDDVARRRETIQPPISSRIPALRPSTNAPIVEPASAEAAPSQVDNERSAPVGHDSAGSSETGDGESDGATDDDDDDDGEWTQPSAALDEAEGGAAGLSGAWFADGELDADARLDERQEQRLAAARDNVAREPGTSFDELYYEPKSKRLLLIAGAIGGVVLLIIILAIAWPSSGSRTSGDTAGPREGRDRPADILAQLEVPDAGPPAADAGVIDAAAVSVDTTADTPSGPNDKKPRRPGDKDKDKPRRPPDNGDDDGNDGNPSASKKAAFYAQIGQTQLRNGDIGSAKDSFKKALDLDAGNADALMGMGELELENGASANAIKLLQQAARKKNGSAHLHTLLGDAYLDAGKAEKAVEQFKQALRLDPDSTRARNGFDEASAKLPPPKDDI